MRDEIKATFVIEKTTKGAVRYQEVADDDESNVLDFAEAKIGTLYVRKRALPTEPPRKITVEVSW